MFSLKKKIAIVTGGSGSIGLAISKAYAQHGAHVVVVGKCQRKLEHAIERIREFGNVTSMKADVSNWHEVTSMVDKVGNQFGKIDILVTAAGIQHRSEFLDFDHDAWKNVLDVNLNGTFYCCQAVAKKMSNKNGGRIIMISSLTAEIGIPNIAAYAASRGAIKQLSRTMATELAKYKITVNCIGPGRFHTAMTEDIFDDELKYRRFIDVIPMGRAGVPADLEGIAIFLASDASSYITGQSIYVDGGWLSGGGNIFG